MKKETNYKSWSFRLLVYIVLLNILSGYLAYNYFPLVHSAENFYIRMMGLSIIIFLLLVAGIVFTIFSVKNKEEKDYKYKFSIYGYPIYIVFSVIVSFLQ
ncbi:conserved membrane hypothetical protein [Tenacibaculum sp. 190524A05c]|uniref:Uncharacterized protein n=1 Tax=Tenacibaculum platacis TaxID=3137852 RepID=A0ABP1ERS9_9FLAO